MSKPRVLIMVHGGVAESKVPGSVLSPARRSMNHHSKLIRAWLL
jgi:hypothetical protein